MYKSPIELIVDEITHQIVKQKDENIYQAVLSYIPNVDREELLRALEYDRGQYEKGYMDGKADAIDELVKCKDCKHWLKDVPGCTDFVGRCEWASYMVGAAGYCVYGERKDEE